MNEPNLATIRRYFNFFSSDPHTEFCVAYFSSTTRDVIPGCGTIFATGRKIISEIIHAQGMEAHMLINKSDGLGRKRENITGVQVFVLDIDRWIESSELKSILLTYHPHMVVRTSLDTSGSGVGKYHLYWRADSHLHLSRWEVYERGIAELLGGDLNSAQRTKLMRVPGIPRITKSGEAYLPELLVCEGGSTAIDPRVIFPGVVAAAGRAKKRIQGERTRMYEQFVHLGVGASQEGAHAVATKVEGGKRNESIYWISRELVVDGQVRELRELMEVVGAINQEIPMASGGPLEKRELLGVIRSAWNRGVKKRREIERKREMKKGEGKKLLRDTEYDMSKVGGNGVSGNGSSGGNGNGHEGVSHSNDLTQTDLEYPGTSLTAETVTEEIPVGSGSASVSGEAVTTRTKKKLVRMAVAERVRSEVTGELLRLDCIELLSGEYRKAPYSQRAIGERVLCYFRENLCELDDRGLLAFNNALRVWELQELGHGKCGVLYDHMLGEILYNMLYSREFKEMYGYNGKGEFDEARLEKERDRIRSISACQKYLFHIFNSKNVAVKSLDSFDSGDSLILCDNGLLDMQSGEFREPRAGDYLLKRTRIKYEVGARCVEWEEFIGEIFSRNSDPESSIKFLQELFGYSISGENRFQYVFCHLGEGANGKSTVLGALRQLVGQYGTILGPDVLSKMRGDKFERLAVKLMHLRCAIIDDVQVSAGWDEAFVKNLTARELEARNLYKEVVVIRNTAKIHVCLNQMPEPETNSKGFFRRIKILNYDNTFDQDGHKSLSIERMIKAEISGILNWAIEGYRRLCLQGKFTEVAEGLQEEREYREMSVLTDEALREMFEVCAVSETTERLLFHVERVANEKGVVNHFNNVISLGRKLRKLFPGSETQVRKQKRGFFLRLTENYQKDEKSIL